MTPPLSTFVQIPLFMIPSLRVNENLHIILWLLKDLCWLMEYRMIGLVMVPPTIAMAVYIAWQSRQDQRDLMHAIAVICWILANSTWMVGDFFFEAHGHLLAEGFFIGGLVLLAVYYMILLPWRRYRTRNNSITRA